MGFMDSIRKLTHPYSDAEDDYDEYDDELPEEEPVRRSSSYSRSTSSAPAAPVESNAGRVVSISPGVQLQVILVKPDRFDQVSEIADHLRAKEAVVLNLEGVEKNLARRVVDVLSGCGYALDGTVKKVSQSTYIFCPHNMEVLGDLKNLQGEVENYV